MVGECVSLCVCVRERERESVRKWESPFLRDMEYGQRIGWHVDEYVGVYWSGG